MTTKEQILHKSLKLFSKNGYEAVSVEQIASSVGIKAPSLYKHYKSKKEIFNAIFEEMQRRYDAQTEKMQLHLTSAIKDREKFAHIDAENLVKQVQELISYSLHDEFVDCFRKLMTIEQFRSPEFSALYTERYVNRMINYHESLFSELISVGAMRKGDVHSLSLQYTCPILVLLSICDRHPEKEDEIMAQIESHVRQFLDSNQTERGNVK